MPQTMDSRVCVVYFLLTLIPLVSATVTITYKFEHFFNHEGVDYDGNPCDPFGSNCDVIFHFCFDDAQGSGIQENFARCPYGYFVTGEFHGWDSVDFNPHDLTGGLRNPIELHLDSYPLQGLRMKVDVIDDDTLNSDDDIDKFFENYDGVLYGWNQTVPEAATRKVYYGTRGRHGVTATSLVLLAKAQCDPYWYGPRCNIQCPQGYTFDNITNTCAVPGSPQSSGTSGNFPGLDSGNGIFHEPVVDGDSSNNVHADPTGLIIGLVCGIGLAILVVIIAIAVIYRYKKKQKLLQSQGVNTHAEAHFDNPGYGVGSQRPSTASTNALIPGGTGTGTQATVATGSQGTQAGYLVMAPPPYISDNRTQAATQNSANGTIGGVDVYDTPRPTHPPQYQPNAAADDDTTYEAMALPPKTRRY